MSDYIKREGARRAIAELQGGCITEQVKDFVDYQILSVPSADVVEVVRCKDCKYWRPHTQCGFDEDNDEYHNYCGYHMPDDEWYAEYWEADDYCRYGERKEQSNEHTD